MPAPRHPTATTSKFANKRTPFQREEDLELISRLYHDRKTQREIVEHLASVRPYTLSIGQVALDIKTLIERLQASQTATLSAQRARELGTVNHVELLALEAFHRCQKERVRTVTEQRGAPGSGKKAGPQVLGTKASVTREQSFAAGAQYLQIVLQCVKRRCELLGLDAPERTEVSGPNGGPVPIHTTMDEALTQIYVNPRSPAAVPGSRGPEAGFSG